LRSGQVLLLFIICVLFLTFRDWQKENEKLLCFGFETELVFWVSWLLGHTVGRGEISRVAGDSLRNLIP